MAYPDTDRRDALRPGPSRPCPIWAFARGVLPGLDVLRGPKLRSVDWHWPLEHPTPAIVIAVVWVTVIVLLIWFWSKRVDGFKQRVAAGFAILKTPKVFFTGVVSWQALSWVFRAATVYFFLRAFHLPATAYTTALVLAVQSLSTLTAVHAWRRWHAAGADRLRFPRPAGREDAPRQLQRRNADCAHGLQRRAGADRTPR